MPPSLPPVFSSLYALDEERAIWRLDASSRTFQPLTPDGAGVISFAVSPSDGAMVYGDDTGAISILHPGSEARVLLAPQIEPTGQPLLPISMEFSNSGASLAFALSYPGGLEGIPAGLLNDVTAKTGLWTMDMSDGSRYQLIPNQYPTTDNVSQGRTYTTPRWSPDDQAISVVVGFWEGWDVAWLFPLGGPSPATLHDPVQQDWAGTAWAPDSSGLYLFGKVFDDVSNIDFADRSGQTITTYVDGSLQQGYVSSLVPISNSVLFAARFATLGLPTLYLGKVTNGKFAYSPVAGVSPTCYHPQLTAAPDDATVLVSCPDSVIAYSTLADTSMDLTALVQREINPDISRVRFKWAP